MRRGIVIRGGCILAMTGVEDLEPSIGDIRIEDDRLEQVGGSIAAHPTDVVIDAKDRLVMPGLVNAHLHSYEALLRGRYDSRPLELWALYAYPVLSPVPVSDDLVYLRTLLVGIESLKAGVTCVLDDVLEPPCQSLRGLAAVFRAYDDLGMRAYCSGHVIDRPFLDTLPFAKEVIPARLHEEAARTPPLSADAYVDFCEEAIARFHGRAGRLGFVIAPSGPQRCTAELLVRANELSERYALPYHIHVLETVVQAIAGFEFFGKGLVQYMEELGILSNRTSMAHAIWITDNDIDAIAGAGSSVIHNPISNQKLGSGVMPFRALVDAGVNVGLGTDGLASNDSARMFDVMRAAALLHPINLADHIHWPSAGDVLRAATVGGARAMLLGEEIGSLEVGKKADLVILNQKSVNFVPFHNCVNHLVYCENGASVEDVIIDGEIVVRGGRVCRVDEDSVLAELSAAMPEFRRRHKRIEAINAQLEPYITEIRNRCVAEFRARARRTTDSSFSEASDRQH